MSYIEIRDVSKSFGPVLALDRVSIDLHKGEIHALMGGNGSGKSTLIKILGGVYHGDGGTITVGDHVYDATSASPRAARDAGLRFVHQNAGAFPDMSVAENLVIARGYPTGPARTIKWRRTRRYAADVIERYEIRARPDDLMGALRPATQMQVAIARCLEEGRADRVLILDEPTASLPAHEATELANALRRYAAAGETVLFISHRLDEIFGLADRVSVLRDGRMVATHPIGELDHGTLVELMLGRPLDGVFPEIADDRQGAGALMKVSEVSAGPVRDVNLTVHEREIVGVVGLLGSGRTELLLSLFGALPRTGMVEVAGEVLPAASTSASMAAGLALVPEDRLGEGVFLDRSISDNLSVARLSRYFTRGLWRSSGAHRDAAETCRRFGVKSDGVTSLMSTLSGGNQQKVVLGRWMERDPRVLLLDEPTQGVDVTSRAEIYRFIRDAAERGAGVLMVSSDFEEVANLCDRVVVLRRGTVADHARQPLTVEQLTQLAYRAVAA